MSLCSSWDGRTARQHALHRTRALQSARYCAMHEVNMQMSVPTVAG